MATYIAHMGYNYRESFEADNDTEALCLIYITNFVMKEYSKFVLNKFLSDYNRMNGCKYETIDDFYLGEWTELLDDVQIENKVLKVECNKRTVYQYRG